VEIDLFGWSLHLGYLRELVLAYSLAIPVAFNREVESRSAGLRTFPLVAVGSCAYVLIGQAIFGEDADAISRVVYGLMTGIGFIGGGAIVKQDGSAYGTATAAAIWSTGAIGAAVAFHRYEIAVSLTLFNLFTLLVLAPIKGMLRHRHRQSPDSKGDDDPAA
jgi:putative Mg2+ transporter-C (MgtC) family protein